MMKIQILINGMPAVWINSPSEFGAMKATLMADGVAADAITIDATSIKDWAIKSVTSFAEAYRALIASQSAGKLSEYRIKEEIARDPGSASEVELDLLSREAKARGTNRTGLLGQISGQAVAYRQIALLIGVLEAEAGAAINAIPADADDIEDQINTVLGAAKGQAETAFNEALALIKGGS